MLFLMSLSLQRFAESLFHHEAPSVEDYHRHLSFGVMLHGGLFVIANLTAVAFRFHAELSQISVPMHVASCAILLNVPRIYYSVHLRFLLGYRKLRALQVVSFVVSAAAAVAMAQLGFGVYALLAPLLIIPLPYIVSLLRDRSGLIGWSFDWKAYRAPLRFGLTRTVAEILNAIQGALESLLFSMLVGFTTLGLFSRARGLSLLTTGWLSDQVISVLYPSLAKLPKQSDVGRRVAGLTLRIGVWSSAPAATVIAMNEQAAVRLLYGGQWDALIPLLRPVLVATAATSVFSVIALLLLTAYGVNRHLQLGIVIFLTGLVGLVLVLPFDWRAYIVYLALAYSALLAGTLALMVRAALFRLEDVVRAFAPCLILAAAGVLTSDTPLFEAYSSAHPTACLFASGAAVGIAHLLLVRTFDPGALSTISRLLPGGAHVCRWLLLRPAPQ